MAFWEYVEVFCEECEVTEGALIKEIIYACQGIDDLYVKFDKDLDGFVMVEFYRVPKDTCILVRRLCKSGWIYILESVECGPIKANGTVG